MNVDACGAAGDTGESYLAVVHTKEWEEFNYENGSSGRWQCSEIQGVAFRAGTPHGLREEIREFFGYLQAAGETCEISWNPDNPGEIRVSLLEDDEAMAADLDEIERWKKGELRLYRVFYFLSVEKAVAVLPEEVPS